MIEEKFSNSLTGLPSPFPPPPDQKNITKKILIFAGCFIAFAAATAFIWNKYQYSSSNVILRALGNLAALESFDFSSKFQFDSASVFIVKDYADNVRVVFDAHGQMRPDAAKKTAEIKAAFNVEVKTQDQKEVGNGAFDMIYLKNDSLYLKINRLTMPGREGIDIGPDQWIQFYDKGILSVRPAEAGYLSGGYNLKLKGLAQALNYTMQVSLEVFTIKTLPDEKIDGHDQYSYVLHSAGKDVLKLFLNDLVRRVPVAAPLSSDIDDIAEAFESLDIALLIDKKTELPSKITLAKQVRDVNPAGPISLYYELYLKNYNGAGAIKAPDSYKTFAEIRSDSKFFDALSNEANMDGLKYLKSGQYDIAESLFEQAIFLNPSNYKPVNNKGIISARKGDHAGAIRMYQKAIELDPSYEISQINLIQSYVNNKYDCQKAKNSAVQFIGSHATSTNLRTVHGVLALAYECLGDISKALSELRIVEKITVHESFGDFRLYNDIGTYLNWLGHYAEAILYYQKSLMILDSELPRTSGDVEIAIGDAFQYQDINIFKASLYMNIGNAYYNSVQIDFAKTFYKKAVTLNPGLYDQNQAFFRSLGL